MPEIRTACPSCNAIFKVPDCMLGKTAKCHRCGARLVLRTIGGRTELRLAGVDGNAPTASIPAAAPPVRRRLPKATLANQQNIPMAIQEPPPSAPVVDYPRPGVPLGTKLGCLALFVVLVTAGGIGGGLVYLKQQSEAAAVRSDPRPRPLADDATLGNVLPTKENDDVPLDRVMRHPWWHAPITKQKANQLLAAILALRLNENLAIQKDGGSVVVELTERSAYRLPGKDHPFFGYLQGGGENIIPAVLAVRDSRGRLLIPVKEIIRRLDELLDQARASEEQFRRTGKGNGILDLLYDTEASKPNGIDQAEPKKEREPGPSPMVGPSTAGQPVQSRPVDMSALATHGWWSRPLSEKQIQSLVYTIQRVEKDKLLGIRRDGSSFTFEPQPLPGVGVRILSPSYPSCDRSPLGELLNNAGGQSVICIFSAYPRYDRALSEAEAAELLQTMLDIALKKQSKP